MNYKKIEYGLNAVSQFCDEHEECDECSLSKNGTCITGFGTVMRHPNEWDVESIIKNMKKEYQMDYKNAEKVLTDLKEFCYKH